jgi:SNF2 family DNA or RNA helicase
MTFLHTYWCNAALYVWAEQDVHQRDLLSGGGFVHSPFGVSAQTLKKMLRELLWAEHEGMEACELSIALPTALIDAQPVPIPSRPFLVRGLDRSELRNPGGISFREWRIDAVRLTERQVITLLGTCRDKRVASGVFLGREVAALRELYRFAGALVARGCFLPAAVGRAAEGYQALWLPVLSPADVKRLGSIAARIPGVALPGPEIEQSAEEFLRYITDAVVRLSVTTTLSRAQALKGKFYSVHDAWFSALRGESSLIRWENRAELDQLSRTLNAWRRPVDFTREASLTLLFELTEPASPAKRDWFLRLKYLKNGTEHEFPEQGRLFGVPKIAEHLLLALGQAALLFSPLERVGKHSKGYGAQLTHQEAHTFIDQSAALLRAGGYEIHLPPWCEAKEIQPFALNAEILPHPGEPGGGKDLESRFDLKWNVTLDGEPVAPDELEKLLSEHSSLVHFRGRWIEIDVAQLQEALRIWQRKRRETRTAREIMQYALGAGESPHGLAIRDVSGEGWIGTFLDTLKGESAYETIAQPAALRGRLRAYQKRGFSWLVFLNRWGLGACLADDMGLGKTVQTIAFILHQKQSGVKKPVLIAGPTSILGNWLHELRRFAPSLRCLLHHGPQRLKAEQFQIKVEACDVVVTSYALLCRDYREIKKIRWAGFVADEAQNIKNSLTHQAQAARAVQADYRIALTGTPMENNVGDIWSLMDFLNPGLLGGRRFFRETFFKPIQTGGDAQSKSRLRKITAPFILRRLKTDRDIIRDLPDKIENRVFCTLTPEQCDLYQEITDSFSREIEDASGIGRRGAILAVLTALKQVCNHPANYLGETENLAERSGKLERLVEMLDEIFQQGESALIFTQYAEMGALLKEHLCRTFGVEMPFLYGGVARKARDIMIDGFQKSGEPSAFILSLKAGGTGLNLTRANHVFHFDRWWNPAVENQATDRAFRIGQKRNVMVHKFICAGTLEERIDALMSRKLLLTDEIVSNGEQFLTELSNQKLKQLLQLSSAELSMEAAYEQ